MADIITSGLLPAQKYSWSTDPRVYAAKNHEFNFCLDAAASDKNFKHENYLTIEDDALNCDWSSCIPKNVISPYVWINPPYGRGQIKPFMQKAIAERENGIGSVLLVPLTQEAAWLPLNEVQELRIITGGRLAFYHPETGEPQKDNPKGSMFVIFRPDKSALGTTYRDRDHLLSLGEKLLQYENIRSAT